MAVIITTYYQGTSANERFITTDTFPIIVDGMGGNDYTEATLEGDLLYGGLGRDVIHAGSGDDTVYGDTFPDGGFLEGEGGDDQILAGSGDDVVFGGGGFDFVNAQDGDDLVDGDSGDDFIIGGLGEDRLFGSAGDDVLMGHSIDPAAMLPVLEVIGVDLDGVTGLPIIPSEEFGGDMGELPIIHDFASDFLVGGNGNDVLYGFIGDDELIGGRQADILVGGREFDVLTGGRGRDQFVFAEYGRSNVDLITDFHAGDSFGLVVSVFKGLGKAGTTLKVKYFHVGDNPQTKNDRVIFDEDRHKVFYDRDGSGGKYGRKQVAWVEQGTFLDPSDFDLI